MALQITAFGDEDRLFSTSGSRNVGLTGNNENFAGYVKDKEYTISFSPAMCTTEQPDVDNVSYITTRATVTAGPINFKLPISLPDGCKILGVTVFGDADTESWTLYRIDPTSASSTVIFSAAINSEDTTPTAKGREIVDNANWAYVFNIAGLDAGEDVYGAKVRFIFEGSD